MPTEPIPSDTAVQKKADERKAVIRDIAEVLCGLQVPVSIGMPLGTARDPWERLHARFGQGWSDADDYEAGLRKIL